MSTIYRFELKPEQDGSGYFYGRFVVADDRPADGSDDRFEHLDHHFAHGCTAYLTSPFRSAAIVVCDHSAPGVSIWRGEGAKVTRVDWAPQTISFAHVFSRFSVAFGWRAGEGDQQLEALARLQPLVNALMAKAPNAR